MRNKTARGYFETKCAHSILLEIIMTSDAAVFVSNYWIELNHVRYDVEIVVLYLCFPYHMKGTLSIS